MTKRELLPTIRDPHRVFSKHDKTRILNEFVAVTGQHRKHAIRLLGRSDDDEGTQRHTRDRRFYDETAR